MSTEEPTPAEPDPIVDGTVAGPADEVAVHAPTDDRPPVEGPDAPGDDAEPLGRPRLRRAITALVALVVVAVVAASFIKVDYYRFSPGSLYDTEELITVNGHTTFPDEAGRIDFTTVSSKKASILEYYLAGIDEAVELVDAELFEGGRSPEENRKQNLEMMAGAKQNAEVAALRKLGYPVVVRGTGALIKNVSPGVPAAEVLHPGDTIVRIGDRPIELGDDAIDAISAMRPGDPLTMTVEAAPGEPREVTTTLVSRCATLPEGRPCPPEEAGRPLLGVGLANRDTTFELPIELGIDTRDVGGPSAGLALTLGIIDVLTEGDLTGGKHVAATGTVDFQGDVGPIGGIKQKTHLVMRAGVPLFLVPMDEYEQAAELARGSGTRVVGVRTLDEALAAIEEFGGSTDVVAQEAAARGSSTTAPPR